MIVTAVLSIALLKCQLSVVGIIRQRIRTCANINQEAVLRRIIKIVAMGAEVIGARYYSILC